MNLEIRPMVEDDIPAVSQFLISGFQAPMDAEFAAQEILHWKSFDPCGGGFLVCGFVAKVEGQVVGYIGLCPTTLVVPDSQKLISAGGTIDWLATKIGVPTGIMLMLRAHQCVDVLFGIGGTEEGRIVSGKLGLKSLAPVSTYCRVLWPLHYLRSPRPMATWKCLAKIAREYGRWLRYPRQKPSVPIMLRQVESFGAEVTQIMNARQMSEIHTLRTPELLNHFLRYPRKKFTGWHIRQDERIRGFALLSITQQGNARLGRIADCFLDSGDIELWHATLHALTHQLSEQSADMVVCYGTTSWMAEALTRNGFYCLRQQPFAIRDPKKLLPENASFYLTHMEADHAYL